MKKNLYTLATLLLAALALPLTSCDWWEDDEEIAYTLEGTWSGDMRISTEYRGHRYYATMTEITFLRDPYRYSSGEGYWVDYYSDERWDYVANHISWTVNLGDIDIYFREEGTSITIRNYRLNNDRFVGTLYDSGNRVEFSLRHTTSPNWDRYDRWGYDGWYAWVDRPYQEFYSRPTRAANDTDRPVRHVGDE